MVEIVSRPPITESDYPQIFFVAEDGGELVGSVIGHIQGNILIIDSIQTNPPQRRKGIGTSLLNSLVEWGKSQGAIKVAGEFKPDTTISVKEVEKWYSHRGLTIDLDSNLNGII